jgi:hypothetical protein
MMAAALDDSSGGESGLRSGGLGGRKLGETIQGSSLTTGGIGMKSKSLSSKSGVGKALSEFEKAKEAEKANAANIQSAAESLKSIEKGINGG